MLREKRKVKLIAMIVMVNLLAQVILPILSTEVFATEEVAEETETTEATEANQEITRNYEIKEEETWDVSANNDGSVMAKWTKSDRTIIISGTGKMKDWISSSKEDWHDTQYTNLIEKVVIKEGVTGIGNYAFKECSSLENITIPEGITIIADYAFYECSILESITIPEEVTSIGDGTFYGCTNLENIIVDENNKNYMDENGILFSKDKKEIMKYPGGKRNETVYNIPEVVTSIEDYAFEGCSSLENIIIPEGVTSIGWSSFEGCSALETITIPKGITRIEGSVFSKCSSLVSISIPNSVTNIGSRSISWM